MNCKVRSAHDEGIYCVDVAVVKCGHMPTSKKVKWLCAENSILLTYAEGKKIGWKDGVRALYCIIKYNWFR